MSTFNALWKIVKKFVYIPVTKFWVVEEIKENICENLKLMQVLLRGIFTFWIKVSSILIPFKICQQIKM